MTDDPDNALFDVPLEDPVYHHDRKTWTTRLPASLPEFKVESTPWHAAAALHVECPRCKQSFVVSVLWPTFSRWRVRSCPYCFLTSRIPQGAIDDRTADAH